MAITAKDVQKLREMTGVGMMDCKKALTEAEGDFDKAIEWLREKGLAAQTKKAGKVAAEGVSYAIVADNGVGVVIEVNSQTDFVAKNEVFQDFVKTLASIVANENPADVETLKACRYPGTDRTVADVTADKVLAIGENIQIRRFVRYAEGVNVPYIHMGGKIGVLVNLEVEGIEAGKVTELGKDVAMQIAAMNPAFLDKSDVDQATLDKEKEILLAQAKEDPKNANKPENIIEKMVLGRIGKYYEENCLLQQAFVKENKVSVEKHVAAVAKELGGQITVKAFTRFATGEGIEAGKVIELGKDVAMQIAAMNPAFLDKSDVSQETLDKEKEIQLAMMANDPKMAAKPEKVKEGIVMGKLGKYYEENCLLQQAFVKENKISVEKHVAEIAKQLGGKITVKAFTRFATGEGIEKAEDDFAAEVASMVK